MKITLTNKNLETKNIPLPGYQTITVNPFATVKLEDVTEADFGFYNSLAVDDNNIDVTINGTKLKYKEGTETVELPPFSESDNLPKGFEFLGETTSTSTTSTSTKKTTTTTTTTTTTSTTTVKPTTTTTTSTTTQK